MSTDKHTSYILHLPGWYPSRHDPLTGDFVQRHIHSVAPYRKSIVLFLIKDPNVKTTMIDVRTSVNGNLVEYLVYYPARGPLQHALSFHRYLSMGSRMVRRIVKEHGEPSMMHVHIVWKAGVLALRLHRRFGWKYLVTENWTGYSPDDPHGLHKKSPYIQHLYKKVFKHASLFLPVSEELAARVQHLFPGIRYKVVYNVADTALFHPPENSPSARSINLLHVSTMNYQKNIAGILRVLERLNKTRPDIHTTLVGPCAPEIEQWLADKALLGETVTLTGALAYHEVALQMQQADALFLFSLYENLPCVILEAHCSGLPVIATRVGGIPEIVDDSNGILVTPGDENGLLQAIISLADEIKIFDSQNIAHTAQQRFSYSVIGQQLAEIYQDISSA